MAALTDRRHCQRLAFAFQWAVERHRPACHPSGPHCHATHGSRDAGMPSAAKLKKAAAKKGRAPPPADKNASTGASAAPKPPAIDRENVRRDVKLVLPPSLTPRQRAVLHEAATAAGLPHESTGEGSERHLVIGDPALPDAPTPTLPDPPASIPDDVLSSAVLAALGFDPAPFFASAPAPVRTRVPCKPRRLAPCQGVEEFVARTAPLIEAERAAEVSQAQELASGVSLEFAKARGVVLANLRCAGVEGGLLGRFLVSLVGNKNNGQDPLPPHNMSNNDVVEIRPHKGDGGRLAEGVVCRVEDRSVTVAVDEVPEDGMDVPLRLVKLANEVTYQRMRDTLAALGDPALSPEAFPGAALVDVLFGKRDPQFEEGEVEWVPFNANLDESQRAAVSLAMAAKDVALCHGPPGTGKTTAVVEVVRQEAARGSRVLAVAASNVAVDNLVERLVAADPALKVVRVGHPARLLPQVLDSSLETHVLRTDSSAVARECRDEMRKVNAALGKLDKWKRAERRELQGELRRLRKDERVRQERAVDEVLGGAQVTCCTLTGLQARTLRRLRFDVCVIDEAAQALEVACWAGILRARKLVLAGDHLQLPPTVLSPEAERGGLGQTLFERLHGMYGESVSEMLTTQYRMHARIMEWSGEQLYGGRLTAHPSVAAHTLADLGAVRGEVEWASDPLVLVDTAGCDMGEVADEADSKGNPGEAAVVMALVKRLCGAGLRCVDIGVITPYSAQVGLLRDLRGDDYAGLEISTVDGFQGREKEAIVISMVRSNTQGEVGFLADKRRMNVAVTRARRHCSLVCDTETVRRDPFLETLVRYFEEHASYHSAEEFLQDRGS